MTKRIRLIGQAREKVSYTRSRLDVNGPHLDSIAIASTSNNERQKEIQITGQSTLGVERQSSKKRHRVQASVWSKYEGELEKEALRRERWLPHVLQSTVGQIGGHDQI